MSTSHEAISLGGAFNNLEARSESRAADSSEVAETEPIKGWSVMEGRFDPAVTEIDNDRLADIAASAANNPRPDTSRRVRAIEITLYGLQLVMPERFVDEEQAETIESDVVRAAQVCSFYTEVQLNKTLKDKAEELTELPPPSVEVLRVMFDRRFIEQDTLELGEGIVNFIYLKQSGRENELPPAYTDDRQRWNR